MVTGSHDLAAAILDSFPAHTAVVDAVGRIVAVNRAWSRFAAEHPGDPWRPGIGADYVSACEEAAASGCEQAGALAEAIVAVLSGRQRGFHVDYPWRGAHEELWFSARVSPLDSPGGGALVSHSDITTRKRAESNLAFQALHDPLTGLPNRTLFLDRLSVALARMARSTTTVAVLFLDLDNFKHVNDGLGHDAGDAVLVAVGERISGAVRPQDTAARFGGDEFTVLCEGITSQADAVAIADRMGEAVREPLKVDEVTLRLTPSIGITMAADATTSPTALLQEADAAMYQAKQRGRARWEVFDEAMRAQAHQRMAMEQALHLAIDRQQLTVEELPEIDIATGHTVAVELLLRWHHPDLGLLPPGHWMSLAEESGLSRPFARWVLTQACLRATAVPPDVRVTVNLSARQLGEPDLLADIETIAAEHRVPLDQLCVDITDDALAHDRQGRVTALAALRQLGVAVALDHFGTGTSSVASLSTLPLDAVKIDGSFIGGLGTPANEGATVGALIVLAHALGLRAVASWVESATQLERLRELGCDAAQGFHLSGRPE